MYGAWLAGWALGVSGMGVHHKICPCPRRHLEPARRRTRPCSPMRRRTTPTWRPMPWRASSARWPPPGGRPTRPRAGSRDLAHEIGAHLARVPRLPRGCRRPGCWIVVDARPVNPRPRSTWSASGRCSSGTRRSTPGRRLSDEAVSKPAPRGGPWSRGSLRSRLDRQKASWDVATSTTSETGRTPGCGRGSDHDRRAAPGGAGSRRRVSSLAPVVPRPAGSAALPAWVDGRPQVPVIDAAHTVLERLPQRRHPAGGGVGPRLLGPGHRG